MKNKLNLTYKISAPDLINQRCLYLSSQLQSNLVCFSLQFPTVGTAEHQLKETSNVLEVAQSLLHI